MDRGACQALRCRGDVLAAMGARMREGPDMVKTLRIQDIREDKGMHVLALSVIVASLSTVLGSVATFAAAAMGIVSPMIAIIVRTIVSVGALLVLGGGKWLRFNLRNIQQTWSWSLPLVMINCLLGGLTLAGVVFGTLAGGLALQHLLYWGSYITLLCLFVSVNEEVVFRGLTYGGMLDKLGSSGHGIVWAAVGSSLLFGATHVIFILEFANWYVIVMGFLKTMLTWL